MRIGLGTVLLLAATSLVGLTQSPVAAATGCDAPDTTWVGPATDGGSVSWAEPANWTNDVPTAMSAVCIPGDVPGPKVDWGTNAVANVIDANASTVTLAGTLTVSTSFDVATLAADDGRLQGPGTTTLTDGVTGSRLTFLDAAVVDLPHESVLDSELQVWDGSRLNIRAAAVLTNGADIDALGGLVTITQTGSITLDDANTGARITGGFANHGEVKVSSGQGLLLMGNGPRDALPDEFSTGTFTGAPGAEFTLAYIELRTGAHLDHVARVDHITVPVDNTASISGSTIAWDPAEPEPNLAGAGELVVTDDSAVEGRISGSLTVTVPVGEVVRMGDAIVQDHARIRVNGELSQVGDIYLEDEAVLDIYGAHRAANGGGGLVHFRGADPGIEIIHPEGRLLSEEGGYLGIYTPVVNRGTADSGNGIIVLAPDMASPEPSSGTYRAGASGTLVLGDAWDERPDLVLDQATIEGQVLIGGVVRGSGLQVRGRLETSPGSDPHPGGELVLAGTTTLEDGASITGDVTVAGQLDASLGPTGTATLDGATVTGQVHVVSGALSVPSLAPTTLQEDGTLTSGEWIASLGATLDLPAITTVDTELALLGGSSFGDGLANLSRIGPNGTLLLGGDLGVPGVFRNEGTLFLDTGCRLDVGGKFRQSPTGSFYTYVDSAGRGQVRAAGPRDLAGKLVVQRDPAYTPPVGTVLSFISSEGRKGADDAFDKVVSPKYGSRKIRVDYGADKVRLRVDRVG